MKWIGLSGGIATGKSAVSEILRSLGIPVIDADVLAREVVAPGTPGLEQVLTRFGPHLLKRDGSLDRKLLGSTVFGNAKDLVDLENILHPLIQNRMRTLKTELEQQGAPIAFYDVALLFEKNLQANFDGTVLVWCEPGQQIDRLMKRDHLDRTLADQRIAAQIPINQKKDLADFVIDNSKDLSHLKTEVRRVLDLISGPSK